MESLVTGNNTMQRMLNITTLFIIGLISLKVYNTVVAPEHDKTYAYLLYGGHTSLLITYAFISSAFLAITIIVLLISLIALINEIIVYKNKKGDNKK